jgi:serine/threonine protein kinase
MAQPRLSRAISGGYLPIYQGNDIKVTCKPALNFDGIPPAEDRLWFGGVVFEIADQEWVLDEFVNYGAEGQTYLATRRSDSKRFVAKFCSESDSKEIKLLQQMPRRLVGHPNFITYEMIVLNVQGHLAPAHHIIFMEHVPNGELFELLSSQEPSAAGKPLSEGTIRRFLRDLIHGMAECYRFGITHRDLKPENLLINEQGSIVIIDLGHAKRGEAVPLLNRDANDLPPPPLVRTSTTNAYGTEAFNAPEVTLGMKYDCELADIWSVGVIAFYLHAKLPAFESGGGIATWDDITGADNSPFWQQIRSNDWYPSFSEGLVQFINMLLRKEPEKRPSFIQLEKAISGDADTISKFPGLHWLSQPVNDSTSFLRELRCGCPGKAFKL